MTRTFSKIYGLGGLRVGWGYGPQEIVDTLNRVRGPFNLSTLALQQEGLTVSPVSVAFDTGYAPGSPYIDVYNGLCNFYGELREATGALDYPCQK